MQVAALSRCNKSHSFDELKISTDCNLRINCSLESSVDRGALSMAFSKKYLIFAFVTAYGFLWMLTLIEYKHHPSSNFCSWKVSCVPFCCVNSTLCKETTIRETMGSMNQNLSSDPFNTSLFKLLRNNFTILYGKPTCPSLGPVKEPLDWIFTSVRKLSS